MIRTWKEGDGDSYVEINEGTALGLAVEEPLRLSDFEITSEQFRKSKEVGAIAVLYLSYQ